LGEYGNILLMSTLFALIFLGGWLAPFFFTFVPETFILQIKTIFICFVFILVRATLPRYRYDQLMDIAWQIFLPFNLIYIIILVCFGLELIFELKLY
jgi:NADH-quinone oxidoreductase subunit H